MSEEEGFDAAVEDEAFFSSSSSSLAFLRRSANDLFPPEANDPKPPPFSEKALNALEAAADGVVEGVVGVPKADFPNADGLPNDEGDPKADFFSGVLTDLRADDTPKAGFEEASAALGVLGEEANADTGLPNALVVGVLGGLKKGDDDAVTVPKAPNAPEPDCTGPNPVG